MSLWVELLGPSEETITLPWVGGRQLRSQTQTWMIDGRLPLEHNWYTFQITGRKARNPTKTLPIELLSTTVFRGYLVGNRLVVDGARVHPDPKDIAGCSETVFLLADGLDRFARIVAGRVFEGGPLIFQHQDMPVGPEEEVLSAFLDGRSSIDHIKGVPVALDAAFRMELWQKQQAELRRIELAQQRIEEEARLRLEEERLTRESHRRELVQRLGDAVSRRQMAQVDFGEAARAALAISGTEYLDHRRATRHGEMVVRFRLDGRRFECVCNERLQILDAGVCLAGADKECSVESLPSVIREAIREDVLVIYRHVD